MTNAKTWTMRNKILLALTLACNITCQAQDLYSLLTAPTDPLKDVKKVAVLDFTGKQGRAFTDMLTQQLMDPKRGLVYTNKNLLGELITRTRPTYQPDTRTNVYAIAERGQLERVLAEQRLSNSGVVDEAQAAQLGKVLGIDAIIMGTTDREDGYYTESDMHTRWVKAKVTMKVVSVHTGEVLTVKATETSQDHSAKRTETLVGVESLSDPSFRLAAYQMANAISPYFDQYLLEAQKVKVKAFSERSKRAMDLMEKGEYAGAYALYNSIHEEDAYCAEASHNMATILAGHGDYLKAREFWTLAVEIDKARYAKYLTFVDQRIAELPVLEALGVVPGKVAFDAGAQGVPAKQLETRGSKADRYDVRTQPEATAEVISRVPGKTPFDIIEVRSEWILVKLIGGKQGWISKEDVKL